MAENLVDFIVEYDDGRTARMAIHKFTVSQGDHVALRIAAERQHDGSLPTGTIKAVRRAE